MIAIIDYEAGNIRSAARALAYFHAEHVVTSDPDVVARAQRIVIPGDGEAYSAMESLRSLALDEAITDAARRGVPILGICIGAQIVLDHSDERDVSCLGLIAGRTVKLAGGDGLKIPHMGWNTISAVADHPLFDDIAEESSFYFVHSYYPAPRSESDALAVCDYGERFAAVVGRDNIVATQFHPEKSGEIGLKMLRNFLEWRP